jgi:hypothetical protein
VCCEQQPYGGENGCGLYFCSEHKKSYNEESGPMCERCAAGQKPFTAKPDHIEWLKWKLRHKSWRDWRVANPDEVAKIKEQLK